ncbi:MAG TPA: Holliday junction resolvase RuvX [Rhodocyclaceae bacterium]|nr:Holliday junction resolvase RuvX [Rhodocyclaceae bacterium]
MPTLLGFDFGTARIGVAVGETETGMAQALTVIEHKENAQRFSEIGKLITEWRPASLVVGLPTTMDGLEHDMTLRCRRFANQLHGRFDLPVQLMDERLTSSEADDMLKARGMNWRQRKRHIDALAAQRILQSYLDTHGTA